MKVVVGATCLAVYLLCGAVFAGTWMRISKKVKGGEAFILALFWPLSWFAILCIAVATVISGRNR